MDYHVFILSRIQEAVTKGEPTVAAIGRSIGRTAGVITAAALVMVCVFSLFGTVSSLDIKQAGVGLAAAVLIDATAIRSVLLPATMALLGERNWYLPHWLAWLLRLARRGSTAPSQAIAPAPEMADHAGFAAKPSGVTSRTRGQP
jgi:putative drug exporter of the RND superfamily